MKFALLSLFALAGCNEPKAASPPCKTFDLDIPACAALYETQLVECTATSSTRAESERCEDDLRARFKRRLLDGGAP